MPSRNVVFGRQQPGTVAVLATWRNGPQLTPSSVDRVTQIVAGEPQQAGNDAKAAYTSPAASTDGYMYVVEGPVACGAVSVAGAENVWPRSRETATSIFDTEPSNTDHIA